MLITFSRSHNFYTKIFIIPSIILVILAYITFWINSKKAPARVILGITNINSAISLLISTNNYIPQVPYSTWL
jgi:multisubunit Na+/H+ antiporter MnhC subunit